MLDFVAVIVVKAELRGHYRPLVNLRDPIRGIVVAAEIGTVLTEMVHSRWPA